MLCAQCIVVLFVVRVSWWSKGDLVGAPTLLMRRPVGTHRAPLQPLLEYPKSGMRWPYSFMRFDFPDGPAAAGALGSVLNDAHRREEAARIAGAAAKRARGAVRVREHV
jgi:hypothetical protein